MDWAAWSYFFGSVFAALIAGSFGIYISHVTRQTRNQVTPSNGTKTAELVEQMHIEQRAQSLILFEHMAQDAAFQARVEPYLKGQP